MQYLTNENEIKQAINELSNYPILWLDTEIANWDNPLLKRLSLVQVLANIEDINGESVYLLDLLDKPKLVNHFIDKIMINENIEKVFHNAPFDVKYLGGKDYVKKVTCTLKLAKEISLEKLGSPNRKLKTLASCLCDFTVEENEQASDWSKRPLTANQLKYATMDVVFLAQVHRQLLIKNMINDSTLENLLDLKPVSSEVVHQYQPVFVKKNFPPFKSLTVDNIKLGLECSRLLYLVYHQGGESNFYIDSLSSQVNEQLNNLINKLTHNLQHNKDFISLFYSPEKSKNDNIYTQIKYIFYVKEVFPYIILPLTKTKNEPDKNKTLLITWFVFQEFAKIWTKTLLSNSNYLKSTDLMSKSLIKNQTLESRLNYQEQNQLIKANIPNIIYDLEQKSLIFIQPNTEKFTNPEIKLVELALLTYLLKENTDLKIEKINYWLLNANAPPQKLSYSDEEIETTLTEISTKTIPQLQQWLTWQPNNNNPPPKTDYPQLCDICPQKTKCQIFFESINPPPSSGIKLPSPFPIEPPPPIGDKVGKELISVFNSFGAPVDYHGAIVAPSFVRVKIKPHRGIGFRKIKNLSEDLKIQIGFDTSPLIQSQAGYVSIDIPRDDRQFASFEQYVSNSFNSSNEEFKISLGIDIEGNLVEADLSDSNTCHFLIGGTTGSGKSEFLRAILLSLLVKHSPDDLKIVLVDPKRVTFPEFENIRWLHQPIIKDEDEAISLMQDLVEEMELRYRILEQNYCPDIATYNRKIGHDEGKVIPRIVCIFDEYADFMTEKGTRQALEQSIKRLGAKARAAGINLIIATQRPDANVVTPLIRSNLPGRVALKTASEADSSIILGGKQNNAAYLLGKGDLLYLKNGQLNRLQSLFLRDFSFN